MRAVDVSLRGEMKTGFAAFHDEMQAGFAALRSEREAFGTTLHNEIQAYNASHREDIQDLRSDINSFKNTMIVVVLGSWVTLMAAFISIFLLQ